MALWIVRGLSGVGFQPAKLRNGGLEAYPRSQTGHFLLDRCEATGESGLRFPDHNARLLPCGSRSGEKPCGLFVL